MQRSIVKARIRGTVALGLLALVGACKKTADGNLEVKVPKIVTETETLRTPAVEVQKETTTIITPRLKVRQPGDSLRDTTRPR